jgi:uncharacterized protein (DUF1810 family)
MPVRRFQLNLRLTPIPDLHHGLLREIFGTPDDMKFKSSMTLFAHAVPENSVFIEALNQYCGGKFDSLTLDLLRSG